MHAVTRLILDRLRESDGLRGVSEPEIRAVVKETLEALNDVAGEMVIEDALDDDTELCEVCRIPVLEHERYSCDEGGYICLSCADEGEEGEITPETEADEEDDGSDEDASA